MTSPVDIIGAVFLYWFLGAFCRLHSSYRITWFL